MILLGILLVLEGHEIIIETPHQGYHQPKMSDNHVSAILYNMSRSSGHPQVK